MRRLRPFAVAAIAVLAGFLRVAAAEPIGGLHCNDSTGTTRAAGRAITITGVVSAQFSTTKSARFYVQDSTGGVCVFGPTKNCAAVGDSVRVSGQVASFNGLTQITGTEESPLAIEALGKARAPVVAIAVEPGAVRASQQPDGCEPNEGRLLLLHDVLVRTANGAMPAAGATFADATNYRLVHAAADSSTNWAMMRVTAATGCEVANPVAGAPIPIGTIQVAAVLSQYLPKSATTGGYQLLPRSRADLQPPLRDPDKPLVPQK